MNTECLFTVCSRAREHEHLGEQLVNSAAASVEQDRVVLHVAAADVLVQCGRPRRRRRGPGRRRRRARRRGRCRALELDGDLELRRLEVPPRTASWARSTPSRSASASFAPAAWCSMTATPCSRTPRSRSSPSSASTAPLWNSCASTTTNRLSRQDFKMTVVREKDNSDGDTEEEAAAK